MEYTTLLLLAAVVSRVILDLFSMFHNNYIVDILYGIMFMLIGITLLLVSLQDIFGYICIAFSLWWGGRGIYKLRANSIAGKSQSEQTPR